MKLSYEDHEAISVVTVSGELLADQSDAFRRTCQDRMQAGIRDIVLDLEYMTQIDSAGLEALLWIMDELAERHGQMRLVNPDETIKTVLEVTRLNRKFDVHDSIQAAAKSLR